MKGKIQFLQKPSNKRIISVIFYLLELLYHTTVDKKAYELKFTCYCIVFTKGLHVLL